MTPKMLRSWTLIIGLTVAAIALISWSQSWFIVSLNGQFNQHSDLAVGGDTSAPAIVAVALASAAGLAAMAISGPFFRVVLALLEIILAGCVILSAVVAISDPTAAVSSAVTKATNLEGAEATARLISSITLTVWPFIALGSGVLMALLGIAILVTGQGWPASGRRYEPVRFEAADPPIQSVGYSSVEEWDELSGGSDPTSR